jgi:hypothetical protein
MSVFNSRDLNESPWAFFAREKAEQEAEINRAKARAELRDRFAGYALIGLLSGGECKYLTDEAVANRAWEQADAMMKARGHE